jgi:hypothetical protein
MEGLTEGRIVHYVLSQENHRPAIIVKVWDANLGNVELNVFWSQDDIYRPDTRFVHFSEQKLSNSWHWIEKA